MLGAVSLRDASTCEKSLCLDIFKAGKKYLAVVFVSYYSIRIFLMRNRLSNIKLTKHVKLLIDNKNNKRPTISEDRLSVIVRRE